MAVCNSSFAATGEWDAVSSVFTVAVPRAITVGADVVLHIEDVFRLPLQGTGEPHLAFTTIQVVPFSLHSGAPTVFTQVVSSVSGTGVPRSQENATP